MVRIECFSTLWEEITISYNGSISSSSFITNPSPLTLGVGVYSPTAPYLRSGGSSGGSTSGTGKESGTEYLFRISSITLRYSFFDIFGAFSISPKGILSGTAVLVIPRRYTAKVPFGRSERKSAVVRSYRDIAVASGDERPPAKRIAVFANMDCLSLPSS